MKEKFIILVADRNKHIRELLKRELSDDGYQVILAKTVAEVVTIVSSVDPIHLIVIDDDLPDGGLVDIMLKLKGRLDRIPVVHHSCHRNHSTDIALSRTIYDIEKGRDSISRIRILADQISRQVTSAAVPGKSGRPVIQPDTNR